MPSLITPIQPPSSILFAIYANVTTLKERELVLGKDGCIEIYGVGSDGLQLKYSLAIEGKLSGLKAFKPLKKTQRNKKTGLLDWIFFVTHKGACYVVTYENGSFVRFQDINLDFEGRGLLATETLIDVDQSSTYLALHAYQGYIKLYRMQNKLSEELKHPSSVEKLDQVFHNIVNHSLDFVQLVDTKFIPGAEPPLLSLLYMESDKSVHFSILHIQPNPPKLTKKLSAKAVDMENADFMVPLAINQGVLIIGPSDAICVTLDEDDVSMNRFPLPGSRREVHFTCYTSIDDRRFLLGDHLGGLYLLILHFTEDGRLTSLDMHSMGTTAPAEKSLVHLSSNYFFAASHFSHSVLFQLDLKSKEIIPIQEIKNVAPVTDILSMREDENSNTLLVGSGGFESGCLRKLKSGRSVEVLAEFSADEHIQKMWSWNDNIVVTTLNVTRIFSINEQDGSVTELHDFNQHMETGTMSLELGYIGSMLYQVTTDQVICLENGKKFTEFIFSFAVFSKNGIVACVDNNAIVVFNPSLEIVTKRTLKDQVSCVTEFNGEYCIIGFWNNPAVMVLSLENLETLFTIDGVDPGVLVRSLMVKRVDNETHLLIGLADGKVLSYSTDFSARKTWNKMEVVCGRSPVTLFDYDENRVLVSSSRSSLLSLKNGAVYTVPLNLTRAVCGLPVKSHGYYGNNLLLFACDDTIKISKISNSTSVSIHERYLEKLVFKIEPVPTSPNILVACTVQFKDSKYVGKVELFDSNSLDTLDVFDLKSDETVQSIAPIYSDTIGLYGFVVGTCIDDGLHEADEEKGRVLLFTVNKDTLKLQLWDQVPVPGGIYALAFEAPAFTVPTTRFLVAINNQVRVIEISTKFKMELLEFEREYQSATYAVSLSSFNSKVVMGDLLRGVSYGTFETSIKDVLNEASGVFSVSDVELIDEHEFLVSDVSGSIRKVTIDDNHKSISMNYNFDSSINKLRRVDYRPAKFNGMELYPNCLLGTSSGGVYLHFTIPKQLFEDVIETQLKLPDLIRSVNSNQSNYEKFRQPYGVLDGELLMKINQIDHSQLDTKAVEFAQFISNFSI